jgi:pantoate--beta-alanine ligase
LTPADREVAVVLSRALFAGRDLVRAGETDARAVTEHVAAIIGAEPRASLEYVELVDADTLESVDQIVGPAALLTAAWFGDVRLIDNVTLG